MRILIADDEDTLRSVIRQVLSADSYDVVEAASGERALELFRENPFPIVISDMVMGRLSGLELLKEVKELSPDCVFILMTSHASIEAATSALRSGAYDFLTKPFDDIDVVSAIAARAVEKIRLAQENVRLVEDLLHKGTELERLNVALQDMANRDPLTGLYNRRYVLDALEREISRSKRHGRSLSLLIVDVDHFKRFNDSFGHLVGDEALKALARALVLEQRAGNVAGRYGGEEFVVLAPETEKKGALVVAERIRSRLHDLVLTADGVADLPRLTVSVGLSTFGEDGLDATGLFRSADAALYRAKAAGRDRVCAAGPAEDPAPAASPVVQPV